MPLVDNKLPVRFSKFMRPGQLAHFQAERFAKFDAAFDSEDRLATAVANMNVNGSMFVAVKEEPISVLLENFWHCQNIFKISEATAMILSSRSKVRSPFRVHGEVFVLQAFGDAGGLFGLDLFGGGA